MFLLGYDCGTSSIKATLIEAQTGTLISSAISPSKEMGIISSNPGWAEQEPDIWWENAKKATRKIFSQSNVNTNDIKAIGISYQMHGLVCVDKDMQVLRPSIIWCDSRAVEIGEKAAKVLGSKICLEKLLNFPGNFTASKLKWIKENEPDIFSKTYKIMLPGDYIAMKMTDQIVTTESGLSEMTLWNFEDNKPADFLMDHYGLSPELIPGIVPTFGIQGELTKEAAGGLGLKEGTKVTYRAGDQPNNALSLNVLNPGEIAATAGTSGVVYGVTDKSNYDTKSRVNTFVHVNHTKDSHRYGILLCINGTGALNSWLKHNMANGIDYDKMNEFASEIPVGSEGLIILPFGNGAERTLENRDIGAHIHGLNLNTHTQAHLFRAGQEGIVFAMNYGLSIMQDMGLDINKVKAGNANMFLSPVFSQAFSNTVDSVVELYNTDGSQGAARGAGLGVGIYKNANEAYVGLQCRKTIEPQKNLKEKYSRAYQAWLKVLNNQLNN